MHDAAFLITEDVQLKSGSSKMTDTDRAILTSVKSGEGLTEMTSEKTEELAKQAQAVFGFFRTIFQHMPLTVARFVRGLRVEEYGTWRYVAEACSEEYGGDWGSNQLAGMALCERAAQLHGEDFLKFPWN